MHEIELRFAEAEQSEAGRALGEGGRTLQSPNADGGTLNVSGGVWAIFEAVGDGGAGAVGTDDEAALLTTAAAAAGAAFALLIKSYMHHETKR